MNENTQYRQLCSSAEISGAISEEVLLKAERDLDVVFPDQYRAFLSEFGAAALNGITIFGLPDPEKNDPPMWENVVDVTKRLRELGQAGLEDKNFIPFSDDGMGVYFFLNTEKSPDTEIHVIGPGVCKMISNDFCEFVVSFSDGKISL